MNNNQTDWDVHLDGVLFAYRTSVHKSTGFTPFEIMFGRYIEGANAYTYPIQILLNFRKAVMPIEAESDNSADYTGPHQYTKMVKKQNRFVPK